MSDQRNPSATQNILEDSSGHFIEFHRNKQKRRATVRPLHQVAKRTPSEEGPGLEDSQTGHFLEI